MEDAACAEVGHVNACCIADICQVQAANDVAANGLNLRRGTDGTLHYKLLCNNLPFQWFTQ